MKCADQIETLTQGKPREFDLQGLLGVRDLTFASVWWEKLNKNCEISNTFFGGAEVANECGRDGINYKEEM